MQSEQSPVNKVHLRYCTCYAFPRGSKASVACKNLFGKWNNKQSCKCSGLRKMVSFQVSFWKFQSRKRSSVWMTIQGRKPCEPCWKGIHIQPFCNCKRARHSLFGCWETLQLQTSLKSINFVLYEGKSGLALTLHCVLFINRFSPFSVITYVQQLPTFLLNLTPIT